MTGDRAARFADEQPTNVILIAFEGNFLVHHGRAGWRQDATGDNIAYLAFSTIRLAGRLRSIQRA